MSTSPNSSPLSWRGLFETSATPIFVIAADRSLRYANPAWERLTESELEKLRGTRFAEHRESASPLWKSLAPPPEAWASPVAQVRRPPAGSDDGPPWWDVSFLPLFAPDGSPGLLLGSVRVVGDNDPTPAAFTPAAVGAIRAATALRFTMETLVGPAPATARLVSQARAAANSDAPVWLRGEPGTGKETIARVIHHTGPRREEAFLSLACAGLQPYLIDGLLAGKGGLQSGPLVGTLLLKQPETLPRDGQRKLLDWVFTRPGPRLICASSSGVDDGVRTGKLLPTFAMDCCAMEIVVPPLRDRLDDLPRLAERVLARQPPPRPALAEETFAVLRSHRWPGNVREFVEVLHGAVSVAGGSKIERDHLPRSIREKHLIAQTLPPPTKGIRLDAVLEEVERRLVTQAVARANGNLTTAANRLGIPRERLIRRLKAWGLPHSQTPEKP